MRVTQLKSFTKPLLIGGLLVSFALAPLAVMAGDGHKHCPHHGAGFGPGKGEHHLLKKLDLSDEQKAALKAQREAKAESRKALGEQHQQAKAALMAAAEAGESDSKLQFLADALGKLQAQQALARAQEHKAFLTLLTPEQKTKLDELKAKREAKMQERKDKWLEKQADKSQ